MNDVLIVATIFLMLLAAVAFYFYGQFLYVNKKIGLLESVLLDIKMNMEMEQQVQHGTHGRPEPTNGPAFVPMPDEAAEVAYYSSVLDEVAKEEKNEIIGTAEGEPASDLADAAEGEPIVSVPTVNYESMTREELAALAEKRGFHVTKRTAKGQIVHLLREGDKKTSGAPETGEENAPAGVDASTGGASLDAGMVEELPGTNE